MSFIYGSRKTQEEAESDTNVSLRPLETPIFYEGVEISIYIIKLGTQNFFY